MEEGLLRARASTKKMPFGKFRWVKELGREPACCPWQCFGAAFQPHPEGSLLQGAAALPDFVLLHLAQCFCWHTAHFALLPAPSCPMIYFFFFYHLVHNKLLVTTEGLWHLLHGQGLSKRCKNAITQPTTVLLPEQAQPSPRGLASQDFICIIFHLKPAVTLILTLAECSAALCALMHCQGW